MITLRRYTVKGVLIAGGLVATLVLGGCASTQSGQAAATGALWGGLGGAAIKAVVSPGAALEEFAVPVVVGAIAGAVTGVVVAESVALFQDTGPVVYTATQPQVAGVVPMAPTAASTGPLVIPSSVSGNWSVYELSGGRYQAVNNRNPADVWNYPAEPGAFCLRPDGQGRMWSPDRREQCPPVG